MEDVVVTTNSPTSVEKRAHEGGAVVKEGGAKRAREERKHTPTPERSSYERTID